MGENGSSCTTKPWFDQLFPTSGVNPHQILSLQIENPAAPASHLPPNPLLPSSSATSWPSPAEKKQAICQVVADSPLFCAEPDAYVPLMDDFHDHSTHPSSAVSTLLCPNIDSSPSATTSIEQGAEPSLGLTNPPLPAASTQHEKHRLQTEYPAAPASHLLPNPLLHNHGHGINSMQYSPTLRTPFSGNQTHSFVVDTSNLGQVPISLRNRQTEIPDPLPVHQS